MYILGQTGDEARGPTGRILILTPAEFRALMHFQMALERADRTEGKQPESGSWRDLDIAVMASESRMFGVLDQLAQEIDVARRELGRGLDAGIEFTIQRAVRVTLKDEHV